MPRGKKRLTLDEKIEKLQQEIHDTENHLSDLKNQLAKAQKEKEDEEMRHLYQEIKKQGLTIEEAVNKLKS